MTEGLGHLSHVDIIRSSGNKGGADICGLHEAGEGNGGSERQQWDCHCLSHTHTHPAVAGLEAVARKLLLEPREV